MSTNLVSGGRITGRAVTAPHAQPNNAAGQLPSSYKRPFRVRHHVAIKIVAIVALFATWLTLVITKNNISGNLSKVKVLIDNATTWRAQSVYTGQDGEMARLIVTIAMWVAFAGCLAVLIWLIAPPVMDPLADWSVLILVPMFLGFAMLVVSGFTAFAGAAGSTDPQQVYNAGSNWLELKHNLPYDVANYMYHLDNNDASSSFAHNVTVTTEQGDESTLTISQGGADQQIFTLHLRAKQ